MMNAKMGNVLFDCMKNSVMSLNNDINSTLNDNRIDIWLELRTIVGSSLVNGLQYGIWYNFAGIQPSDDGNDDA